jgi:hypothetical protein
MFAVELAFFSADFALNEVSKEVLRRVELLTLGRQRTFGETAFRGSDRAVTTHPEFWQPLYSAPSFADVAPEHANGSSDQVGALPVVVNGFIAAGETPVIRAEGYKVESSDPLPNWDLEARSLDPVYIQPATFYGHLAGRNAGTLELKLTGEPLGYWQTPQETAARHAAAALEQQQLAPAPTMATAPAPSPTEGTAVAGPAPAPAMGPELAPSAQADAPTRAPASVTRKKVRKAAPLEEPAAPTESATESPVEAEAQQ